MALLQVGPPSSEMLTPCRLLKSSVTFQELRFEQETVLAFQERTGANGSNPAAISQVDRLANVLQGVVSHAAGGCSTPSCQQRASGCAAQTSSHQGRWLREQRVPVYVGLVTQRQCIELCTVRGAGHTGFSGNTLIACPCPLLFRSQ